MFALRAGNFNGTLVSGHPQVGLSLFTLDDSVIDELQNFRLVEANHHFVTNFKRRYCHDPLAH